ncbi:hypothetical protein EDD37DRAFT_681241 [Exophiala viscosa]|uniref:uncharacterized protein n=1 Tax=Exophiala viscosa TaxID=2486360 RepID=UPI00218F1EDE|nr:hypothetical protein EDD37DRAFT_681241 [Exophiala viscosa]
MRSTAFTASLLATATFISSTIASPLLTNPVTHAKRASDLGLAVYWGQGPSQKRLSYFCQTSTIDIIPIGFVNVFPDDSGSNGYPGTNYGNACSANYWIAPDGAFTQMFTTCDEIAEDVQTCQDLGIKILVSLGGASDVTLNSSTSAVDFADFLWGAYGPEQDTTETAYPRPFGSTIVDGFDLDIESGSDTYYADLVTELRVKFATYTDKSFYISGAPQCVVPDAHLDSAIQNSYFDYVFVQYYNTESCSAAALFNDGTLDTSSDPSWGWIDWLQTNSYNPDVKLYVGLPASTSAYSGSEDYYLDLDTATQLLTEYACNSAYSSTFGGVMIWEATYSENNQIDGESYAANIKDILGDITCSTTSTSTGTTSTTTTSTTTTTTSTTTTTTTTSSTTTTSTSTTTVAPSTTTSSTTTSSTTTSSSTTTPTTTTSSTSTTTSSSTTSTTSPSTTTTTSSSTTSTTSSSSVAPVSATASSSTTSTSTTTSPTTSTTTSTAVESDSATTSSSTTTTTSSTSTATEVAAGQTLIVVVNMDNTKKNKRDTYYLGINDDSIAVLGSQADAATLITGDDGTILYGAEYLGSNPVSDSDAAFLEVFATEPADDLWLMDSSGALTLAERQFCVLSSLEIETVDAAGDNCDGTIVTFTAVAATSTSTTSTSTSTTSTSTSTSSTSTTTSSTTTSTTSTTTTTASSSVGPVSASTASSSIYWNTTSTSSSTTTTPASFSVGPISGSVTSSTTTTTGNAVDDVSASTTTSEWSWATTSSTMTTTSGAAVGPISYSVSTSIWTTVISDEYTLTWDDWTTTSTAAIVDPTATSSADWNDWTATSSSAIVDPTATSSADWNDWTSTSSSAIVDPTVTSSANWADWSSVVVDPVSVTVTDYTTTVWVTSYIDVCPTGFTTLTYTLTTTVPVAPASATTTSFVWPTTSGGVPEGFTTAVTTCTAGCAESWTVVTVTIPIATTTALITETIVPVGTSSSSGSSVSATETVTGAGSIVSAASSASIIVQAVQASSAASSASAAVETLSLSSIIVSPAETSAAQSGWLGVAATTATSASSSSKSTSTSVAAVGTYTGAAAKLPAGTSLSVAACLAGIVGLLF